MISTSETLEQRMTAGRIAVPDALRIGMMLAEQLRQLHEQGKTHGALSPAAIAIADHGIRLLAPPLEGPGMTPYTPPEVLEGKPADARSDIFSFGAILYEMLTARHAFEGDSPEALAKALTSESPRPSGSVAFDRLVGGCLAKSPDSRYQRVNKLMLELRLLTAAVRRTGPVAAVSASNRFVAATAPDHFAPAPDLDACAPEPALDQFAPPADLDRFAVPATEMAMCATAPAMPRLAPAPVLVRSAAAPSTSRLVPAPDPDRFAPSPHTQMSELEGRIAARMEEQEKSIASVAHVANEVLRALRQQQAPVVAANGPRSHSRTAGPWDDGATGRAEHAIELLTDRVSRMDMLLSSVVERLQKVEESLDAFDIDAAAVRDSVTRDMRNFERALKAQNTAIESARTAMGQTDDLVERVVEALDSLQSMFVSADERSLAS